MSKFTKFATTCAALAVFSIVGFSQITLTVITGTFLGKDGKPVQGGEIKFSRTDMKANYSIKTNKEGKFTYPTLPLGVYDVTFTINGKDEYKVSNIHTDPKTAKVADADLSKVQVQVSANDPAMLAAELKSHSEEQSKAQGKYEQDKKAYDEAQLKDAALQKVFGDGMEASRSKNWDGAVENFTKASQLDPTQDVIWGQLGEAYSQRAAGKRGPERMDDYGHSVEANTKAVELKPDNAAYHNNLAMALARSQKLEVAQTEIAKAVELDPPQAGMYYRNLGTVYFDANLPVPAGNAYRKSIEADPTNAESYYRLGLSLTQQATDVDKDSKIIAPPGTAEALQKYLELSPNGSNAAEVQEILKNLSGPVTSTFKTATPAPSNQKGKAKGK